MSALQKIMAFGLPAVAGAAIGIFALPIFITGSQLEYFGVKLKIDGNELIVDKSNKCDKGKHKGCLLFEEDEVGVIRFYMKGSKNKVRTCNDNNVEAVITKIVLTTTGENGDPEDTKGNYGVNPATWLKDDAFPGVKADGEVYNVPVANARTQAWLVNMNSHVATGTPKPFWYKVTATACEQNPDGTRDTWTTDPRGDNEGRN